MTQSKFDKELEAAIRKTADMSEEEFSRFYQNSHEHLKSAFVATLNEFANSDILEA